MLEISLNRVGEVDFLTFDGTAGGHRWGFAIPVPAITYINLHSPNGASTNCVSITTSDQEDPYYLNYDDADAFRDWLRKHRITE